MGVTYKLKPEVVAYILEMKKSKPDLSCRGLMALVDEKFAVKISKSSINSIFKSSGLSMPVGRRKVEKVRQDKIMPERMLEKIKIASTAMMAIGGSLEKEVEQSSKPEVIALPEAPEEVSSPIQAVSGAQAVFSRSIDQFLGISSYIDGVLAYLYDGKPANGLPSDLARLIPLFSREVRCLHVRLMNGGEFYLDAQLHRVWSNQNTPTQLSLPVHYLKHKVSSFIQGLDPLVLFMAPGYDQPTKEFFDFILSFSALEKKWSKLTFLGSRAEELEVIESFPESSKGYFLFGLWPWQFGHFRKVTKMGEFKPFIFEPLGQKFLIAETEIEISQINVNEGVTLRGCILKRAENEQSNLVILTNYPADKTLEDIATAYLIRWPNLEEGFQDFCRKIEFFTQHAGAQEVSLNEFWSSEPSFGKIDGFVKKYAAALELTLQKYFLPLGLDQSDFAQIKQAIFNLDFIDEKGDGYTRIIFKIPQGFPFPDQLKYACRRLNEKEIVLENTRVWFSAV